MIKLDAHNPCFPSVDEANANGLLAMGGNLEEETLLTAYKGGIFPWYQAGQPLLWWSPDPRMVLLSNGMHVSRSLNKIIKSHYTDIRLNHNFALVIERCAVSKERRAGTWITEAMRDAYLKLHQSGYAHSVEIYHQGTLVGGLYGIGIGRMFFGESMFSDFSNASKVALFYLCRHLYAHQIMLIDCQTQSAHLQTLGAFNIERTQFIYYVAKLCALGTVSDLWRPQRFAALDMA